MNDARTRKFDIVLVARFDRFARSVKHLITALDEFNHLGVDFISLSESVRYVIRDGQNDFHGPGSRCGTGT